MAPRVRKTQVHYFQICGDCAFCHPQPFINSVGVSKDVDWCFTEPPFSLDTPDGTPASDRGALTNATAPACNLFQPKVRH